MAESEMREKGIKVFRIHLGTPKEQWFESYAFYTKHGYAEYKESYMKKEQQEGSRRNAIERL